VLLRAEFEIYVFISPRRHARFSRLGKPRWPRPREARPDAKAGSGRGPSLTCANPSRAIADSRAAEAIVPAIEPDGRYPGHRPSRATDIAHRDVADRIMRIGGATGSKGIVSAGET